VPANQRLQVDRAVLLPLRRLECLRPARQLIRGVRRVEEDDAWGLTWCIRAGRPNAHSTNAANLWPPVEPGVVARPTPEVVDFGARHDVRPIPCALFSRLGPGVAWSVARKRRPLGPPEPLQVPVSRDRAPRGDPAVLLAAGYYGDHIIHIGDGGDEASRLYGARNVGFKFTVVSLACFHLWTWGGACCVYEPVFENKRLKDKYRAISKAEAARLLGKGEDELTTPFWYRFPPGGAAPGGGLPLRPDLYARAQGEKAPATRRCNGRRRLTRRGSPSCCYTRRIEAPRIGLRGCRPNQTLWLLGVRCRLARPLLSYFVIWTRLIHGVSYAGEGRRGERANAANRDGRRCPAR
jgi:hypothetical protein